MTTHVLPLTFAATLLLAACTPPVDMSDTIDGARSSSRPAEIA